MPPVVAISVDLWAVPMPMPGNFLAYSYAYVHRGPSHDVTIVDPGSELPGSLERLLTIVEELIGDSARVQWIVLTHGHPDHEGLAAAVRARTGAQLMMHPAEDASARESRPDAEELLRRLQRWGVDERRATDLVSAIQGYEETGSEREPADIWLNDGQRLPIEGFAADIVWTPGHTPGHICLLEEERGVILTGDDVLPTVFPGIGLGGRTATNAVSDYLSSLDRIEQHDDLLVLPGHGYAFHGLAQRIHATRSHVLRRASEVAAVEAGDTRMTTVETAAQLTWTGGWGRVAGSVMLLSALAQTDDYRRFNLLGSRASTR